MTIEDVKAELARGQAEAVRMLDEWVKKFPGSTYAVSDTCCLLISDSRMRRFVGDSPEAARANAAEAIRGEL